MTTELSKSTDNPRLTVIIPVYNVEKYLPKCLDSIKSLANLRTTYGFIKRAVISNYA